MGKCLVGRAFSGPIFIFESHSPKRELFFGEIWLVQFNNTGLNCTGALIGPFLSLNTCTVFDSSDVEGWLHALYHFIQGTWVSADFGVQGGPGTNPPRIPRDNLSVGQSKFTCGFLTVRRFAPVTLTLFKGWPYLSIFLGIHHSVLQSKRIGIRMFLTNGFKTT